ncbi:MAG: glycosyltransferase family 39 protein [Anaerolineae bacterium]|nr:glycosyltransferase family 39 protein [Anaerolineae bacterium]
MTKATTSTAKAKSSLPFVGQGAREAYLSQVALIAILILAAALRFGWVGVNSFAWDEARISLDALRMARGGELILAGQPSSVDIPFFPASVWLFAIPFAISPDPLFATLAVAAVSLAMVYGVWSLARHFGALPGLAAALVAAASPYAAFYGRSIWQPNLLAPLALLWLTAWYTSVQGHGRGALAAAGLVGFVGVLTVQIHFAGAALVPATVYAVLRHHRGRKLIAAILGGSIAALVMLPYLYYITVVDPDVMGRFGGVLGGSAQIDLGSVENLLRLATGWDWAFLGLGDGDIYSRSAVLAAALGVGLALGIAALIAHRLRPDSRQTGRATLAEMTLVLLAASPLFFLRHSSPVQIHYQLIAFPAVPLALAAALTLFRTRAWRIAGFAALGAAAAIWTAQIAAVLQSASVARPANSALSSILRESRDAAYAAPEPVLFFTHGDDPALHGEAAVFESLLWDRPHRILNGDVLLILPPYPATLLATLAPFQVWEELEAGGLAVDPLAFPRREGALPFVATAYDGRDELRGFESIPPAVLGDGSTLVGWKARYVGPRFRISTLWQVELDAPPGVFQQFHHLRLSANPDGEPWSISDVPLSRATWRIGDRVVVMADFFEVPAGDTWVVDVGHYTLPDLWRVPRLDGGDSLIHLGPFISAAETDAE